MILCVKCKLHNINLLFIELLCKQIIFEYQNGCDWWLREAWISLSSGFYFYRVWSLICLDEIIWFSFRSCCLDQYPDWHVHTWEPYPWHCCLCLWLPICKPLNQRDKGGVLVPPIRRNNEKTICQRCYRDPIRQFKSLLEMTNEVLTPAAAIGPLSFFE